MALGIDLEVDGCLSSPVIEYDSQFAVLENFPLEERPFAECEGTPGKLGETARCLAAIGIGASRSRDRDESKNVRGQNSGAVLEAIEDASAHQRSHAHARVPAKVDAIALEPLLCCEGEPWTIRSKAHLTLLTQPRCFAGDFAMGHRAPADPFEQVLGDHLRES